MSTSVSDWKDHGNKLFKQGQYREAADCYTSGLAVNPLSAILLSNRCQARLLIGQPMEALADADAVICLDDTSVKGHQRRGRALFDLRRYHEAGQSFAAAARLAGETELGKEAQMWLKRSLTAVKEGEDGAYDWESVAAKLRTDPHASIDCEPFLNPNVHIIEVDRKGLGVVAKSALEPGTLVIAEKAVALAWKAGRRSLDADLELGDRVWAIVKQNDYLRSNIMSLSRGQFEKDTSLKDTPPRIAVQQIVVENKFSACPPNQTSLPSGEGSGLWVHCSRFNHSCLPNCCWDTLGDMMVVRTIRRVEAGEECCVGYISSDKDLEERTAELRLRGFTCDCEFCVYQRELPTGRLQSLEKELEEWFKKMEDMDEVCKEGLPALCKKLDAVQMKYNLKSMTAYTITGAYFKEAGDVHSALNFYSESWKRSYEGTVLLPCPYVFIDVMLGCAHLCYRTSDAAGAKMWGRKARDIFALVFGSTLAIFDLGYSHLRNDSIFYTLITTD